MRWITAVYATLRAVALAAFAGSFAQAQQTADPDERAWTNAQEIGTARAFQSYLEQFPVGRHVDQAFRGLVEQEMEGELGGTRGAVRGMDIY